MADDRKKMRAYTAHLLAQAAESDGSRPSLAQAKRITAIR